MKNIRSQFPIFQHHPNLVYLDTAASSQTPQCVLDAMNEYYTQYRANVHRSIHESANEATHKYEEARGKIAQFLGAEPEEIVFTSGATMGINMLASALCHPREGGDPEVSFAGFPIRSGMTGEQNNIVLTRLEHHSNLIPWQMTANKHGMELRFISSVIPTEPAGERRNLLDSELKDLIDSKTKVVSVAHVSNVLGAIVPIKQIIARAKEVGAITIIDGAQAVAHMPVNVKELDCDFYVFSGHKMYGPTGIGAIYGKKALWQKMKPVIYGGGMVMDVAYESATWADAPHRFEAGTPNIAGAIGLGAAVDFMLSIGWEEIQHHDEEMTKYAIAELSKIERVKIIGPTDCPRGPVISLIIEGANEGDVGMFLEKSNVAVRIGAHCAAPLVGHLSLTGTIRISFGVYTTKDDIDRSIAALKKALSFV